MTKKKVKLISVTPDAEKHIAYVARVSNPKNQNNENFAGLFFLSRLQESYSSGSK